jgi:DNA-binding GntR family transcriptional regulator
VASQRFRGTRVKGADFAEMRESYELRMMLEMRSVELGAPYGAKLLDDLGVFLHGMDAAVKADDSEGYIDNALRFHRRLVESSGNRTFLGVWDSLLWDIRGRIALRRLADQGKSLKALLGRLRAQDVEGATERVKALLERVCSAFEEPTTGR